MNPEVQRRKDATQQVAKAESVSSAVLLSVLRERLDSVEGHGPYANAYRTAVFDTLIALAARLRPSDDLIPVTSSNVESIGYSAETQVMRVRYLNGSIYRYEDVTPEEHAIVLSSDSIGRAVSKLRHHKCTKEE